jgi:hypothetical protein
VEQELFILLEHLSSTPVLVLLNLWFSVWCFVAILRIVDSDYSFGIFNHFLDDGFCLSRHPLDDFSFVEYSLDGFSLSRHSLDGFSLS